MARAADLAGLPAGRSRPTRQNHHGDQRIGVSLQTDRKTGSSTRTASRHSRVMARIHRHRVQLLPARTALYARTRARLASQARRASAGPFPMSRLTRSRHHTISSTTAPIVEATTMERLTADSRPSPLCRKTPRLNHPKRRLDRRLGTSPIGCEITQNYGHYYIEMIGNIAAWLKDARVRALR